MISRLPALPRVSLVFASSPLSSCFSRSDLLRIFPSQLNSTSTPSLKPLVQTVLPLPKPTATTLLPPPLEQPPQLLDLLSSPLLDFDPSVDHQQSISNRPSSRRRRTESSSRRRSWRSRPSWQLGEEERRVSRHRRRVRSMRIERERLVLTRRFRLEARSRSITSRRERGRMLLGWLDLLMLRGRRLSRFVPSLDSVFSFRSLAHG